MKTAFFPSSNANGLISCELSEINTTQPTKRRSDSARVKDICCSTAFLFIPVLALLLSLFLPLPVSCPICLDSIEASVLANISFGKKIMTMNKVVDLKEAQQNANEKLSMRNEGHSDVLCVIYFSVSSNSNVCFICETVASFSMPFCDSFCFLFIPIFVGRGQQADRKLETQLSIPLHEWHYVGCKMIQWTLWQMYWIYAL